MATGVVTFAIRALGVLLPPLVIFGLPLFGLVWWLKRRQKKLVTALAS